jgi:hypothetical protein
MATASGGVTVLAVASTVANVVTNSNGETSTTTVTTCPAGRYVEIYVHRIAFNQTTPGPTLTVSLLSNTQTVYQSISNAGTGVSYSSTLMTTDAAILPILQNDGPFMLTAGQSFLLRLSQVGVGAGNGNILFTAIHYAAP